MKKLTSLLVMIAISTASSASNNPQSNADNIHQKNPSKKEIMDTSHEGTRVASDNPNISFVSNMIPHHISAIEMSERELQKITDPEIKKLAKSIIATQKEEVDFMQNWLTNKTTHQSSTGN